MKIRRASLTCLSKFAPIVGSHFRVTRSEGGLFSASKGTLGIFRRAGTFLLGSNMYSFASR